MEHVEISDLIETASRLSERGKGILAADESTGTIGKRLLAVGLDNTQETRRAFREVLFTAPDIGKYLGGVICFEETLVQTAKDGTKFTELLRMQGVLPGVKVDRGLRPLPGSDGETYTEGLDGLPERCAKYYTEGARFAKWRAVLKIDPAKNLPSRAAIVENAIGLAQYAAIAQANGLVPIVEPEILIDGAHGIEVSAEVAERVLGEVYMALRMKNVKLEASLLKPQMIMPGASCSSRASSEEIAATTLTVLRRCVPPAVPGIMFLSGGQSEEEATVNLNTINMLADSGLRRWRAPWTLSFSYGRALQSSVLDIWRGDEDNAVPAGEMGAALARANSLAQLGKYDFKHPSQLKHGLHETFRGWRGGDDPTNQK